MNRVQLLGNVGKVGELRQAGSTSVLKFTVAVTEKFKGRDGTEQERTEWVNVQVWGKYGAAMARSIVKGAQVFVDGSLSTTSTEKDGVKRYFTAVNATKLLVGLSKEERQAAPARSSTTAGASKWPTGDFDGPDPFA